MNKSVLEVPADSIWRHVVVSTVLSAIGAERGLDLGQLGDMSLLLERALDDIDGLAGVTRLRIEVDSDEQVVVTIVGEGNDVEPPSWLDQRTDGLSGSLVDPLTGAGFEWTPTAITCSLRIQ